MEGILDTRKLFGFVSAAVLLFIAGGLSAQIKDNLDLPFDAIGEEEEEEEAPEVVSFYNTNLEGDGFFYIIDRSATMQDSGDLDRAKQEVSKNIREFSERIYFGVFFFDKGLLKFPSSGQPAQASLAMKAAGLSFVKSTLGGNGTCGKEALLAALQMANLCKAKRKVMVYLSDGGGTCNVQEGEGENNYRQQTLTAVASANVQRVRINTIGVLNPVRGGEEFLQQLARMNNGTYTRIRG